MSGEKGNATFNLVPTPNGNATFNLSSNPNTTVLGDSTLVTGDTSDHAGDEDGDGPAIFLCGRCRFPLGDTLSWAGNDEERDHILLKGVSDNILIGKETHISRTREDKGCLFVNLNCIGCESLLGVVYTSTTKKLDYKRSLFCLNVAAIDSYVLGLNQQVAATDPKEEPVTLEYKHTVEQQLAMIKSLTASMGHELMKMKMEAEEQSKSSDVM